MTYLNFQVPTFYAHLFPNEDKYQPWYERLKVRPLSDTTPLEKYVRNLYHLCGLCIGYSVIQINVIPEMVVTSLMGIIGLLFMTYAFTGKISLQCQQVVYMANIFTHTTTFKVEK